MSVFVQERALRLSSVAGENAAQSIVDAVLEIPEDKPEVERILYVRVVPLLAEAEAGEGAVTLRGSLSGVCLYLPAGEGAEVEAVSFSHLAPFAVEVELPGCTPELQVQAGLSLGGVSASLAGRRRVEVTAVLNASARAVQVGEYKVVVDATASTGKLRLQKSLLRALEVLGSASGQEVLSGTVRLEEGRLPLARVLDLQAYPEVLEARAGLGRAVVEGRVDLEVVYLTPALEGLPPLIQFARIEKVLPFSLELALAGAVPGARVRASALTRGVRGRVTGERELEVEVDLEVWAEAVRSSQVEVVTDIASEGEEAVEVNRQPLCAGYVVGEKVVEFFAEEQVSLPATKPPVEKVLGAYGFFVPSEVRVLEGKVLVDGTVTLQVIYTALEEAGPSLQVVEFPEALHIAQVIDLASAAPGMAAQMEGAVKKVAVEAIDSATLRLAVRGTIGVRVSAQAEVEAVLEAVAVPRALSQEEVSLRIVVVQPGDSLWKLARRYGTSMEQIAALNGLEVNQPLAVGQKLKIYRAARV
ncbi:MAG: DUF3794 domain-containing protein [Bacillota bacterium]|nr:DUF3794 domain-containing protein [Bacillota bacterium]